MISVISVCWLADVGGSHTVRSSSQTFDTVRVLSQANFGRKTVTTAILEPVSQCDVQPPFQSQAQRYHHVSPTMVYLLSDTSENHTICSRPKSDCHV